MAAIINVPFDQPTIPAAINVAVDGDIVEVEAGTWGGGIDFQGKAITVRSVAGPETTIIDGNNEVTCVRFQSGETANSVLEGFTIRKGKADSGGGIDCRGSSPTIQNCIITGNSSTKALNGYGGGGIYCHNSSPTIQNCPISDNSSGSFGGGIYCNGSSLTIQNLIISGNSSGSYGGGIYCNGSSLTIQNFIISGNSANTHGGGIYCDNSSAVTLTNCTVVGNSASNGGGGGYVNNATLNIYNTILWGNTANSGKQLYRGSGNLAVMYCDVEGGFAGIVNPQTYYECIEEDPLFVDAENGDYHLTANSPCIDKGAEQFAPPTDIEGNPRPFGEGVDIGAYEYSGPRPPIAHPQSVVTEVNTPVSIILTGSSPNGGDLTFIIVTQPVNGTLSGTPPHLTYTPNQDFIGGDSFTFEVDDGMATSDPATVSITVRPVNFAANYALSLDGDGDHLLIGNYPSLAPQNFTLEAWFNPKNIMGESHLISRYEDDVGTERSFEILILADGKIRYQAVNNSGIGIEFDRGLVVVNEWQHVAMTLDGEKLKGYLNGELVGEADFTGTLNQPDIPFIIGASRSGTGYFFDGLIDEVRVWDFARTDTEIQTDMSTTLNGDETGLIAYWNFDDVQVTDRTGNGHDGQLMGDAKLIQIDWGVPRKGDGPCGIVGDVSGDKTISAYDASLILQYVVGLITEFPDKTTSSPEQITPRRYQFSIPELSVAQGERVLVPILVNDVTGLQAGGITLKYDSTMLKAVGVAPFDALSGSYWKANITIDSEVRFAFTTVEPLQGNGRLFVVEFEALPNTEGRISPILINHIQLSGSLSIQKIDGTVTVLPGKSRLLQNYPNPFNPETWIPYQLATDSSVSIRIYDVKGQVIRILHLGDRKAGIYTAQGKSAYWDGRDSCVEKVASGVYFYTLQAGDFSATRKMLIVK